MTKAQMRKYLADMKAAQDAAKKKLNPDKEKAEKHAELSDLDDTLNDVFWWKTTNRYFIGIDIWGTNIKYLLRDNNEVLSSGSYKTSWIQNNQDVLRVLYSIIENIIQEYWKSNIGWIWIGSKGRVTPRWSIKSSSFKPLIGLKIKKLLENNYWLITHVVNDASLPYYALEDIEKHNKHILCITLWTGIGTAVYINGKKIGDETFSSQFASTPFKEHTYESYASILFLLHEAQKNNISIQSPLELYELGKNKNDNTALNIFKQYWNNLWEIFSILVNEHEIDEIHISGGITWAVDLFISSMKQSLEKYVKRKQPTIHIYKDKYEIGAYGASKLIEEFI